MRIYLKTWSQFVTKKNWRGKTKTELQVLALALFTDAGASYLAVNSEVSPAGILDLELYDAIMEMRRFPAIYSLHRPGEMWKSILQHLDQINSDESVEIVGYHMDFDKAIFMELWKANSQWNETRLTYKELSLEEIEVAHLIPDRVFVPLESPYGIQISSPGRPYMLSQKLWMLQSHIDYPLLNNGNILADVRAIHELQKLLTSLKIEHEN